MSGSNQYLFISAVLIALVAIGYHFNSSTTAGERKQERSCPCPLLPDTTSASNRIFSSPDNDKIDDNPELILDPCSVFSGTYEEARRSFRKAASALDYAELHQITVVPNGIVPTATTNKDDKDETHNDLTMDIAILHGKQPGLVIHVSGVHGVEGYAGSVIQVAFLRALQHQQVILDKKAETKDHEPNSKQEPPQRMADRLPTIVLVHAMNPFGMHYNRRVNENNVDLNRNGLFPADEMFAQLKVNHTNLHAYNAMDTLFNPDYAPPPPSSAASILRTWIPNLGKTARTVWQHGFFTLKAAMVGGQYHNPKGIFFGGFELQPSVLLLEDFLKENVLPSFAATPPPRSSVSPEDDALENHVTANGEENRNGPTTNAPRRGVAVKTAVTWIDVHTGLGPLGVETLLPAVTSDPELDRWFPDSSYPSTKHTNNNNKDSSTSNKVSKGYEGVQGILPAYYNRRLFAAPNQDQQHEWDALLMNQEFGARPSVVSGMCMVVENAAYHHSATRQEAAEWARRTVRWSFDVQESEFWQTAIVQQGIRALSQAIHRSRSKSTTDANWQE